MSGPLKEAELVCLFQKIQLACAPPSATIAGTKPSRQGKPICVPNERGRQHQHAQSCFLAMASALSCLACSSAPTHSAFASRYASRNLTPFPSSSLETSRRFLSKVVYKKVMGIPTKRVSVSFLHKCGPRRSRCWSSAGSSGERDQRKLAGGLGLVLGENGIALHGLGPQPLPL